jgi:hypothetical protein
MKHHAISAVSLLLLAACAAAGTSMTFNLTMDTTDIERREELGDAALRVIERRLDGMEAKILDSDVEVDADSASVTVEVDFPEALPELASQLAGPFSFEIMAQTPEGATPDVTVEGHGGFSKTGITGDDLEWVEGKVQEGTDFGEVTLIFTEEGRTKMADLFAKNNGKFIGLFVRGVLVSKMQVETDVLKDDIVIREIPTAELAEIFADDVNVGIHVTFTPVP